MNKKLLIGIDRFLAKRWVDYAYDLRASSAASKEAYVELKNWLSKDIAGKETARKTANQIKRLWLVDSDNVSGLRCDALSFGRADPVLSYGIAINVFPFLRDLSVLIGKLFQLHGEFDRNEIQQRMIEKYQSSATTLRATDRCIQTLSDWGFILEKGGKKAAAVVDVNDLQLAGWFLCALAKTQPGSVISLSDLLHSPLKLGISIADERGVIRDHPRLSIERNGRNEEVVVYRE
jgi:hypothetical protein